MGEGVKGVHRLLGLQLRDPEKGRQGRIVGVDQTRSQPALLVGWDSGIERVELTRDELEALVAASRPPERDDPVPPGRRGDAPLATGSDRRR